MEQQVPAAVWRDEGQRKAETRRTECRECSQAGEGSGWICGSFANLTGGLWDCLWSGGGKGERMEKRWEQKICSSLRETSGRMKRVERVRDLKMGKRVCPT